eukprot:9346782-Lingulodinium_polyedra.AAC.1
MTPFREPESSMVVRELYVANWVKPYGRPRWLKFDAGGANLGQIFQDLLERDGTTPLDTPGQAHEQNGKAEIHGRI